ncbi:MAG: histidine kinase [Lachnospiraceae bacterium]|nr:histidine kinase [Lachnospiraceae bacterium]
MKKLYKKLLDMRIREKLILIYVIGGVIPLIIATIYTNYQNRKILLNANKKAESEELNIVSELISENITVMTDVIRAITYDENIKDVATRDYSYIPAQFTTDCADIEILGNLRNYYKQSVSQIIVYIDNDSVPKDLYDSDSNIRYLDDSIKEKQWYKKTIMTTRVENWFYGTDANGLRAIQVGRAIYDDRLNVIGVALVTMESYHLRNVLNDLDIDTMIMCQDIQLYSNYNDTGKYSFAYSYYDPEQPGVIYKKITNGIDEYQFFSKRIDVTREANVYHIIAIENYTEILSDVFRVSLKAIWPIILGAILSFIFIITSAYYFDRRINLLSEQLQTVARGSYDSLEPIGGNDEISHIYNEVERMANDLQILNNQIIDEQVQKEKIHTRQKEVEFKMLASQINPHFLYNTLETIRMKAVVNKQPEIVELVKMLAKIMRYNIQVSDSMVTLNSEISMTRYYLKIQNYRFGDRISSEVIIDENVNMESRTMPLIVQPFVENAFAHGLEEKETDGKLTIHVYSPDENNIHIKIKDNGAGMTTYSLAKLRNKMNDFSRNKHDSEDNDSNNKSNHSAFDEHTTPNVITEKQLDDEVSTHIGVVNVNQRIKMMYGDDYGVMIDSKKDVGTTVIIMIPCIL